MTKVTTASLKTALSKIANFKIDLTEDEILELGFDEALDAVITIATDALSSKSGPSLLERKIKEVTEFVLADFSLAFASNDDIGVALNEAEILSPAGKAWTRSNVSKVMVGVRENIVKHMTDEKIQHAPANSITEVAEAAEAPGEAPATEAKITSASVNPGADPEDELLKELEGLDELELLDDA